MSAMWQQCIVSVALSYMHYLIFVMYSIVVYTIYIYIVCFQMASSVRML